MLKKIHFFWLMMILVALGFGYFLGLQADLTEYSIRSGVDEVSEPVTIQDSFDAEKRRNASSSVRTEVGDSFVDNLGVNGSIEAIIRISDPVERAFRFSEMLSDLDDQKVVEIMLELEAMPPSARRTAFKEQLFCEWGAVSGAIALQYASQLEGRERLSLIAMASKGWARTEPNLAWDSMMTLTNGGRMANPSLKPMLEEIASQDISLAVRMLSDCENSALVSSRFKTILKVASDEGSYSDAYSTVVSMEDADKKRALLSELFIEWGKYNGIELLGSLDFVGDEESRIAIEGVVRGWASVDGYGALGYLLDNNDDPLLNALLGDVAEEMGKSATAEDLEKIMETIDSIDSGVDVLARVLTPVSRADPSLAMSYAMEVENEGDREAIVRDVLGTWARSDLDEAENYYKEIKSPKLRLRSLTSLMGPMVESGVAPERLYALVEGFRDTRDRERAITYLASASTATRHRESAQALKGCLLSNLDHEDTLSDAFKNRLREYLK